MTTIRYRGDEQDIVVAPAKAGAQFGTFVRTDRSLDAGFRRHDHHSHDVGAYQTATAIISIDRMDEQDIVVAPAKAGAQFGTFVRTGSKLGCRLSPA